MKLIIFLVLLVSTCWAQEEESAAPKEETTAAPRTVRAPQGHLQYSDPDGLKVSWKLYSPVTQYGTHYDTSVRSQRAEYGTAQSSFGPQTGLIQPVSYVSTPAPVHEQKTVKPVQQVQVHYKPYSMVPKHIKQLILDMYQPQGPYIDPSVYIYRAPKEEQKKQESTSDNEDDEKNKASPQPQYYQSQYYHNKVAPIPQYHQSLYEHNRAASQSQYQQPLFEHISKYPSKNQINKPKVTFSQYNDEQPYAAASSEPQYGSIPQQRQYEADEQQQQEKPQEEEKKNDDMPKELYQLLNLQAQTPYHVIANRIYYKPKSMFIPKPLTGDVKGPYKYRTKVYYIKDDESEQKSKERTERAEPKDDEEKKVEESQEQDE